MTKKKKEEQREIIRVRFDADTKRLYGNIDEAIRYMAEIRDQYRGTDISLDEHWTGYEDMEMTFVYSREETDDEMSDRLEHEALVKRVADEEARRQKQRKADLAELDRLKRKLGIWH